MERHYPPSVKDVLDRLQRACAVDSDTALARKLDYSQSTVATWRNREIVPYEACVKVSAEKGIDLDYLVFGVVLGVEIDEDLFGFSVKLAKQEWWDFRRAAGQQEDAPDLGSHWEKVVARYVSFMKSINFMVANEPLPRAEAVKRLKVAMREHYGRNWMFGDDY